MKKTIFVVDDSDTSLSEAQRVLADKYRVFTFHSATKMFQMLGKISPDMILIDIEMPEMYGYEAISKIRKIPEYADIPILVITGWSTDKIMQYCVQEGADDFVHKPFIDAVMLKRVESYMQKDSLAKNVARLAKNEENLVDIINSQKQFIKGVVSFIEREIELIKPGYMERVTEYTRLLVSALISKDVYADELRGWDPEIMASAIIFHNIGKRNIPKELLSSSQQPGFEEYKLIWAHAADGLRIIDKIIADTGGNRLWSQAKRFATLHENWDGTGYPDGLREDSIPLEGRILTVADCYDILRSGLSYQPPVDHKRAVQLIKSDINARFEPKIVKIFVEFQNDFKEAAEKFA